MLHDYFRQRRIIVSFSATARPYLLVLSERAVDVYAFTGGH